MADMSEGQGATPAPPPAVAEPVLEVEDLKKHFPIQAGVLRRTVGHVYAVDGVSFSIPRAQTLGLVGESGCGKSTVGRTAMRLLEPTSGRIKLSGTDVTDMDKMELRPYRRQMQIIFQDPFSSLNPRMTAGEIVKEPLYIHDIGDEKEREDLAKALFDRVGLRQARDIEFIKNFPNFVRFG